MVDDGLRPGDRLEGWKDIAAYLRRDVRTVQRWEQNDRLPIHRHSRAQRPIPYAYKSELDAWWTGRSGSGSSAASESPLEAPRFKKHQAVMAAAAVLIVVTTAGAYWILRPGHETERARTKRNGTPASAATDHSVPSKSIAVLPFVDLSEGMKNEEFADGMTEELIDRLNRIPGLRVPAPTSSFYFKNKHVPIAEIATTLQVAYVLDGSVRKSGPTLRVATRLIRVADTSVIWAETYDREWNDVLVVQDDIASEVTKALKHSIAAGGGDGPRSR